MKIGSYISMSDGLVCALQDAESYGCTAMMIYTASPKSFNRKALDEESVERGLAYKRQTAISDIVIHAPYIINPASMDEEKRGRAVNIIKDELEKAALLHADYIVLHPGSCIGGTLDDGIENLAEVLNEAYSPNAPMMCVETMAGKGNEICYHFWEFGKLFSLLKHPEKVGVCIDTCHIYDGGYDLVNNLKGIMSEIREYIGVDKVKVIHVNGSLNGLGSQKDRHANLLSEDNLLPISAIKAFCNQECFKSAIKILETPVDKTTGNYRFKEEIEAMKI